MRSSISSSDTVGSRLPQLPWFLVLGCALALAVAFVGAMEFALAMRGFRPTIVDSQGIWNKQRLRAADLGRKALILVGDSRMQTDLNLDLLRTRTGLKPVELAIEGSAFTPILEGLARDSRVTGTVILGYTDIGVYRWNFMTASARYEHDYESKPHDAGLPNFRTTEDALGDRWHATLISYADGATPLDSLLNRIFGPAPVRQYIVTLPDRSRLVDYSQANLHGLNYRHAIFEIEGDAPKPQANLANSEEALRKRITTLKPASPVEYDRRSAEIEASVQAIQKRGGRVIFLLLPISGFVSDVDARVYPRELFWDRFCQHSSALCMNYRDHEQLRRYAPADGLHLDATDRTPFTAAMIEVLQLDQHSVRPK